MSKVVLFSPVGGTDPISENNYYDGSLLHICRWHKPDEVYIYLSQEILNNENKDHRMVRALKLLQEKIQHSFEIHVIERPDLDNPQDFNYFFKDFRDELLNISKFLNKGDKLLLNVASGTPAMKGALNALSVFGEVKSRCIQVTNPARKMGVHTHSEVYDLDDLWSKDPDNNDDAINRSVEIHCPNFISIKDEETMRNFIDKFDYHAALDIAEKLPDDRKNKVYDYIKLACERADFNIESAQELSEKLGYDLFPVKDESMKQIFEYFLISDLKLRKKEYADFVRSITPMILDIFIKITSKALYPIEDLFEEQELRVKLGSHETEVKKVWNIDKLEELADQSSNNIPNQILTILQGAKSYTNDIYSSQLFILLRQNQEKIASIFYELKQIREKVERMRNISAHQMVQLNEEKVRELTGLAPKTILSSIKKAICFAGGLELNSRIWFSYEDMNRYIIQKSKE